MTGPEPSAPRQEGAPGIPSAGSDARIAILAHIESLEQKALGGASFEAMAAEMLRVFVSVSDAFNGVYWRPGGDPSAPVPVCELTPRVSAQAAQGWRPTLAGLAASAARQANACSQAVSEPADRLMTGQGYVALAIPLRGDAGAGGCVTIVVRQGHAVLTDTGMAMLRLLGEFSLLYSATHNAAKFEQSYKSLSAVWSLVAEMLAFTHPNDQAQVAINRAKSAFHADRVTLGFVNRGKVSIAAISGEDSVDKRSNIARLIQAAQMEVVLSGEAGQYSDSAAGEERLAQSNRNPEHERLAKGRNASLAVSLPLRQEKEIVAVWTFEFGRNPLSDSDRRAMDIAAGHIGPVLHLARENSRGLWRRACDAGEAGVKWVFKKEDPWRRAALAAGILLLLAMACPWKFKISGNCVLEPSFRRVYGAPFDTTIKAAPLRPGDIVDPGQTVVEFDGDEVEAQLREARSKRAAAEKEMMTYLTEQKVSQYAEAKARCDALAAQVELLERHLARTTVKADFAGVIVSGDLKQDIGRTVRLGQELIELAPLDELLLQVEVGQGDVVYVKEGQQGQFTAKARPGVAMPFVVVRVRPMPEVRKEESVYIVEGTVANADGWLRPGMEGAAKVSVGWRNVTWVATRKILNWLRLHLWW